MGVLYDLAGDAINHSAVSLSVIVSLFIKFIYLFIFLVQVQGCEVQGPPVQEAGGDQYRTETSSHLFHPQARR